MFNRSYYSYFSLEISLAGHALATVGFAKCLTGLTIATLALRYV